MFPVISIGPLSLPAPGLILLVGIWIGLIVAERLASNFNANPNQIYNLVFIMLISGVVGARLSYILQYIEAFVQSPSSMFSLNPGLLDPVGGAAVAFITATVYIYRNQIPVWPILDALAPFLAVMWIAIGLSNLASGRAFGMETQMPWGINLWGAQRHPTQIYQVLTGFVLLGMIWFRRSSADSASKLPGETFWLFLTLSALSWMIIETFRGDSILLPGGIRTAQVIAWFVLALSLWGWGLIKRKSIGRERLV